MCGMAARSTGFPESVVKLGESEKYSLVHLVKIKFYSLVCTIIRIRTIACRMKLIQD